MKISLVICTRNRGPQLERCLEAVSRIVYADAWELVVVDNGSTDNTAQVIAAFQSRSQVSIRSGFEPTPGLARARNHGVSLAQGELIAFTDDDCYPTEDFASQVEAAFNDPMLGYVGGRIRLFDPEDYPITILESLEPLSFPPRFFLRTGVVQGANMSFRRSALEQIGGFDPQFGAGAAFPCEDIDAVARASLAGWKGAYVPDIVVFHHHGRKAADASGLMETYDIGRGAYHMKMLLRHGQVGWFLQSMRELWWRRKDRASVRAELRGAWDYASAWSRGFSPHRAADQGAKHDLSGETSVKHRAL